MRIRLFRAFASNNSGSYTIVGTFESDEAARDVAELLKVVCAEHAEWHARDDLSVEAPLTRFARAHALHDEKAGLDDDWPQHGPPPTVSALGFQVLVHAPYTITLPRLFGEFFYARGGRVDGEHNHAHERLITHLHCLLAWDAERRKERVEACLADVLSMLRPLIEPAEHDDRPAVAPAVHTGMWEQKTISVVFTDLVEGVEAVRAVTERHGMSLHLALERCPWDTVDPLALLRSSARPVGRAKLILWAVCEDRVRALKAVREVLGFGLEEAKQALTDLPRELLVNVDVGYAERGAETLRAAGCDAEAVLPAPDRR